jgi:hypothetical protein
MVWSRELGQGQGLGNLAFKLSRHLLVERQAEWRMKDRQNYSQMMKMEDLI